MTNLERLRDRLIAANQMNGGHPDAIGGFRSPGFTAISVSVHVAGRIDVVEARTVGSHPLRSVACGQDWRARGNPGGIDPHLEPLIQTGL